MLGKIISYSVENCGSFAEECVLDFTQNLDNIKNNNKLFSVQYLVSNYKYSTLKQQIVIRKESL